MLAFSWLDDEVETHLLWRDQPVLVPTATSLNVDRMCQLLTIFLVLCRSGGTVETVVGMVVPKHDKLY